MRTADTVVDTDSPAGIGNSVDIAEDTDNQAGTGNSADTAVDTGNSVGTGYPTCFDGLTYFDYPLKIPPYLNKKTSFTKCIILIECGSTCYIAVPFIGTDILDVSMPSSSSSLIFTFMPAENPVKLPFAPTTR